MLCATTNGSFLLSLASPAQHLSKPKTSIVVLTETVPKAADTSFGARANAARENSVRREFRPMAASNRSGPAVGVSRIATQVVAHVPELPPVPRELRPVRRKQRRALAAVRAWAGRQREVGLRLHKLLNQIHEQSHRATEQHEVSSVAQLHDCPTREKDETDSQPKCAYFHRLPLLVMWFARAARAFQRP